MFKSNKKTSTSVASSLKRTVSIVALAAVMALGTGAALRAQAPAPADTPAKVEAAPDLAPGMAPGVVPGARPGGVEDSKPANTGGAAWHRSRRRAGCKSRRRGGRSTPGDQSPRLRAQRRRHPWGQRGGEVLAGGHSQQPRLALHSAQGADASRPRRCGTALPSTGSRSSSPDIRDLTEVLESRRVSAEDAEKAIKEYAAKVPEAERDKKLTELFASVLSEINTDRASSS